MSIRNDNSGEITNAYSNLDSALAGLCEYAKCIKVCTADDATCQNPYSWKNLHGEDFASPTSYNLILQDGAILYIRSFSADCSDNRDNDGLCQEMFVDINGLKKPNQIGRDLFNIMVTKHKVVPNGAIGTVDEGATDSVYCNPSVSGFYYNGFTCGNKILKEGAMNY